MHFSMSILSMMHNNQIFLLKAYTKCEMCTSFVDICFSFSHLFPCTIVFPVIDEHLSFTDYLVTIFNVKTILVKEL